MNWLDKLDEVGRGATPAPWEVDKAIAVDDGYKESLSMRNSLTTLLQKRRALFASNGICKSLMTSHLDKGVLRAKSNRRMGLRDAPQ